MQQDLLIEIGTEELPTRALRPLANALQAQMQSALTEAHLNFQAMQTFATPRRIALRITQLETQQADRDIEKRGPAMKAAYDEQGQPSKACIGFAKSCGIEPSQLQVLETDQGQWVCHRYTQAGAATQDLIPDMLNAALAHLPIAKRMRWGSGTVTFARPVHWVVLLFGDTVIETEVLGVSTGRVSYGHRFMAPQALTIQSPESYETQLQAAFVVADFEERRTQISQDIQTQAQALGCDVYAPETLLEDVTALVEWPVALAVQFDEVFLNVPKEALMSAMIDHQKCFPVTEKSSGQLRPVFIAVSNIASDNPAQVIAGNARVMRARLSDAAFFYQTDLKTPLSEQAKKLQDIVFQKQLGTLGDRAQRLQTIATHIADKIGGDSNIAAHAGKLCKADLVSEMVGEFPELQGTMGYYYAQAQGLDESVAIAIRDHYKPSFAKDSLPESLEGAACALADKLDTLVGIFGIHRAPTGDKDPFALRRAALGVARILIEQQLDLSLPALLDLVRDSYQVSLPNVDVVPQLMAFILDRLKAWYRDRKVPPAIFAAVAARHPTCLYDFDRRVQAVQAFQRMQEADSLAATNKRVSNLLQKQGIKLESGDLVAQTSTQSINRALFECDAERALAEALEEKQQQVAPLLADRAYAEVLSVLASLRPVVDNFFDHVMVMAKDEACRNNRLALLVSLRALFLHVADISLLPSTATEC